VTLPDPKTLRKILNEASPGPWSGDAYSTVFSIPLLEKRSELEAAIPNDAPDSAWDILPEACVAQVDISRGDTPTPQGHKNLLLIELAPALAQEVLEQHDQINRLIDSLHDQAAKYEIQIRDLRDALLCLCALTQPADNIHADVTPLHRAHAEAVRALAALNGRF